MMKKWIFEILDKILEYREDVLRKNPLISIITTFSLLIAIYCILVIGTDIFQISSFDIYKRTDLLRNILLGLGALIAVPFLVWQNTTSHKALHETKENNKNTQSNNQKTQEAKMYIDCITQLASEKETIRTAAIHGLHELIKNTENDSLKEKIFNILWSFMVEHSKKCVKINDEIKNLQKALELKQKKIEDLQTKLEAEQEAIETLQKALELEQKKIEDLQKTLEPEQKEIEKFYSQFKIILQILAYYKDKNQSDWWKDKSMRHIWLHGINLAHTVLENAHLQYVRLQDSDLCSANLQGVDLHGAKLQGTDLYCAKLQGAKLQSVDLQHANLQGADLRDVNLQGANLQDVKLQGANLQGTDLTNVNLQNVDLQGVTLQGINLKYANLQGATLFDANLQGSNLQYANLQGSKLQGADLRYVNLQGANLQDALYNSQNNDFKYSLTQFRENFDPKARGMIDVSEEKS